MTFDHPAFLLLLLLLPVLWVWMRATPQGSRTSVALKCAVSAALVIALAGPWAQMPSHRLAVTVVLDTSASMSTEALRNAQRVLAGLVSKNASAELRLVTFSETARLQAIPPRGADLPPRPEGTGAATDVEAGLQLALDTLPQEGIRRVLLVSDGNENRGSALTAALRARDRNVAVFALPSGTTTSLPVQIESAVVPQHVFSGERFLLSLRLGSSRPLSARISIACQGQVIAAAPVELRTGSNPVDVEARIAGSGLSVLEVRIAEGGTEQVLLSRAVTVNHPRVLYVAGGAGPSTPLLDTLKRADVDVVQRASFPTEGPSPDWDAVVLDNYPDHDLSSEEHRALAEYVMAGGGLIYIFGESNALLSEESKTPLEKLLPVHGEPETPDRPTAVVLVLDKSQSMSGPKIVMARAAARDSLQTLRPTDRIGVIEFDDTFRWVVPIQTASDIPHITTLINSIRPGGSTRIYPPLKAAFDAIRGEKVTSRHIILLTDGVSPAGDMPQLLKDAAKDRVSISAVGVGGDVNQEMLEAIAKETAGRSYFVEDAESLPQVVSGETRKLKASLVQESPVQARSVQPVEFTDGVNFNQAPRLLGFVKAKAKTGAETILRTDRGEPLLVRWQYGLGRVTAFMSDARNRWAANWVGWDGFGTLWPQMVRDVSNPDRRVRAEIRPGGRDGGQVVAYDVLGPADALSKADVARGARPQVVVASPERAARTVALEETSPHHFEARIPSGRRGLYGITSGAPEFQSPVAGFYRESEELRPQAVNVELLRQVSAVSGGRLNPTIEQLLDNAGSLVFEPRALWPFWIALALVLNFVELAARKGFFRRWRFARRAAR